MVSPISTVSLINVKSMKVLLHLITFLVGVGFSIWNSRGELKSFVQQIFGIEANNKAHNNFLKSLEQKAKEDKKKEK